VSRKFIRTQGSLAPLLGCPASKGSGKLGSVMEPSVQVTEAGSVAVFMFPPTHTSRTSEMAVPQATTALCCASVDKLARSPPAFTQA
jgi:hypothetical protein